LVTCGLMGIYQEPKKLSTERRCSMEVFTSR